MIYRYTESTPSVHPVLGLLSPGENEIPDELTEAADACETLRRVEAGALAPEGPDQPAPEPDDEDETAPA